MSKTVSSKFVVGCDYEINNKINYKIKECKMNNRISIIYKIENEKESIFIQYKHDKHLDLEKNESIINNILKNII